LEEGEITAQCALAHAGRQSRQSRQQAGCLFLLLWAINRPLFPLSQFPLFPFLPIYTSPLFPFSPFPRIDMLFHKHLLSLLGLASLAAAAESSNDDEQHAHWHPSYKRKAVNAHFNTSSTEHHFNDYTGYLEYQDLILRHRSGSVKQHKRHAKHKHIFHGKHKKMTLSHQAKDGAVAGLTSDVNDVTNNVASNLPTNPAAGSASVDKSLKETTPRRSSSGSQYKLIKEYSGSSFFDDMEFYSEDDPSHGMVDYVDKRTAQQAGLIGTKNGNAMMKIGYGNGDGVQKAVRVSTKMTFTGGIMLLDAYHMPTGCG
jgi:hypothetical protein